MCVEAKEFIASVMFVFDKTYVYNLCQTKIYTIKLCIQRLVEEFRTSRKKLCIEKHVSSKKRLYTYILLTK